MQEKCDSVKVGGKKDEVKALVRRKEVAWKEVLGARNEDAKERCMEAYKEEKRKIKSCIYQSKKVHEVWKMNQDVNGNRKLLWKEVSKGKGEELQQNKGFKTRVRKLF